jgi:hypothetical protein
VTGSLASTSISVAKVGRSYRSFSARKFVCHLCAGDLWRSNVRSRVVPVTAIERTLRTCGISVSYLRHVLNHHVFGVRFRRRDEPSEIALLAIRKGLRPPTNVQATAIALAISDISGVNITANDLFGMDVPIDLPFTPPEAGGETPEVREA